LLLRRQLKYPTVAREEVPHRAGCNGQQICEEHVHAELTHEPPHQQQATENRDRSIAEVKAEQAGQARATTISSGKLPMPHEIVQYCCLDREAGCPQIRHASGRERLECRKLDRDSDGADQGELGRTLKARTPDRKLQTPTSRCAGHESFSSR
jgi:hypothetical protein